ncbi:hypothetical protein EV702DRAFT_958625 [Suillus placidus]|uniref:BRCT domain-containing protein n=1 Tax=Suillus placidus TaxID=48579 RepID=A0A9P7A9P0_9AGAM|nr:hypothetical protein EV702DRAFT_958625 [Suillus placidus]
MDTLFASQSTSENQKILVHPDGRGYNIHLQVNGISLRPNLVRMMRKGGAYASRPEDADIILVDSSQLDGKRLIRTWHQTPGKVVLEFQWLRKSIEARKPLLEVDGWGGTQTLDDGKPIVEVVADGEEAEVEQLVSKSVPRPQLTQPATPASFTHVQFSQAPPQTHSTQPATQAPLMHPQFSQVSQFSQPQFSQAVPYPQQFPVTQQSYQFGQFPSQQLMPFMPPQSMTMPTGMPFHNLRDPQSFQMLMTLMDVMRNTNGGEFLQAGQPSPMYPQIEASSSAPPAIHHEQTPDSIVATDQPYPPSSSSHKSRSPTPDVVVSKHLEKQPRPSGRKPRTDTSSRAPSTVLLPPSVKRKANHEAMPPVKTPRRPPNKRSLKGKERVVISDESDNDEDAPPAVSDDVFEQYLLSSLGCTNARKNSGEVFLDDQGQPLTFFVQVDLQGRSGVVSNIKKNKGKVIGSIADADYVILFTRSQTFQGLLSEAHACNKVPIQSAFVADSIAEDTLLDESEYALDTGVSVKYAKRGRPSSALFEFVQVEIPSVKKESQKSASKPKPKAKKTTPTETPTKKVKKRSAPASPQISAALPPPSSKEAKSHHTRRSPTPPPPETRKSMRDGKFYFTRPEIEYFCQYAQFLLNEDPTMSTTTLLQAMHKKMPHHPFGSWQMQASSKLKTQLSDIRKRANIAFRKSLNGNSEKSTGEERPGPSKKPRLAALPVTPDVSQETLEREDFEVICEFFANGGGDDDNDERVWERLSQHRPCKSAESWPEYYTTHQTEVYAHIEELVRSSS